MKRESKFKITSVSDEVRFKIYVNGLLHILYPKTKDIRVQSWEEGSTKSMYKIQIRSNKAYDIYELFEYTTKELWELILKELDNIL